MKEKIIATNIDHLKFLIQELFVDSQFNGDIIKWDACNVKDMNFMFSLSKFSNNLTNWKPISLNSLISPPNIIK